MGGEAGLKASRHQKMSSHMVRVRSCCQARPANKRRWVGREAAWEAPPAAHSWKKSECTGDRLSEEGQSLATAARSGATPRVGRPSARQCAFTARHSAATAGGGEG